MNRLPSFVSGPLVVFALTLTSGRETALARKIAITGRRPRLHLDVGHSQLRAQGQLPSLIHNACERTIFATLDAYPFYPRRTEPPVHGKVSHWLKAGETEVFSWNSANPIPNQSAT